MAKAEISMPDDFLDRLSRLGERIDGVSEKGSFLFSVKMV